MNVLLSKIPILRGWISRWRIYRKNKAQLLSYNHFMRCVSQTPVKSIHFQREGCIYKLEDDRSFWFSPEYSAGWLYSVPEIGTFENKETTFVKRLIKDDWVCVDIGACFGWYSVLFGQLAGTNGLVHSFEPIPENRKCLEDNIHLNNCKNVVLNNFALGAAVSVEKIYVPKDGVSGSLKAHDSPGNCKIIDINVSTLDKYFEKNSTERLDFIKADIEGAELLMLKGAFNTLVKFQPVLMLEIQSHSTQLFNYQPTDIFKLLKDIGYSAFYVTENGALSQVPQHKVDNNCLCEYNFIFLHENHEYIHLDN